MKVEPSGVHAVDGEHTRYHLRVFRLLDKHFVECPVCFSIVAMDSLVSHGMSAHDKIFQEPYLLDQD